MTMFVCDHETENGSIVIYTGPNCPMCKLRDEVEDLDTVNVLTRPPWHQARIVELLQAKVERLRRKLKNHTEAWDSLRDNLLHDPDQNKDTINWALGYVDVARPDFDT